MLNCMTCPTATGEPSTAFSSAVDVPVSASQEHAPRSASAPALRCLDRVLNENIDTSVSPFDSTLLYSESRSWFKNGTDHTPIPLFADSVKQFSYGPP
jgi:hypothetical protein